MPEQVQTFPGIYPLGSGIGVSFLDSTIISSAFLNTRDLYSPGAPDFVLLGPGSEVWYIGYSIRVGTPPPFPPTTDPLGVTLRVSATYENQVPFIGAEQQSIILPTYGAPVEHSGFYRLEAPVGQISVSNLTGDDLEISFAFWGKAQ